MYLLEIKVDPFQPSINIEHVQEMLAQSHHDLSANAEKCKEFIKHHMRTNRTGGGPPNMAQLMSFITQKVETTLNIAATTTEPNAQKSTTEYVTLDGNNGNGGNTNNGNVNKIPYGLEHSVELAKLYFDHKLMEMETRLTNKIDERLDRMEAKQKKRFDEIIELLRDNQLK